MTDKAELARWAEARGELTTPDVKVPPELIRAMLMESVRVNWPRYEVVEDHNGDPVALRFGSPAAANKALELLARDAGMMEDDNPVRQVEIRIVGVDTEALK